jgi:hypothetical protein
MPTEFNLLLASASWCAPNDRLQSGYFFVKSAIFANVKLINPKGEHPKQIFALTTIRLYEFFENTLDGLGCSVIYTLN